MKKLAFRAKMILGSLLMVTLVMLVAGVVVSIILNRQIGNASRRQIFKASEIVRDEIGANKSKLIYDLEQVSKTDSLGSNLKFMHEYKRDENQVVLETSNREIARDMQQIGHAGNFSLMSIYDLDGEIRCFYKKGAEGISHFGYTIFHPQLRVKSVTSSGDEGVGDSWTDGNTLNGLGLSLQFPGNMPETSQSGFTVMNGALCLAAYQPIFAEVYSGNDERLQKIQVGLVAGFQELGADFVQRMARLTGLKINIFTKERLSAGEMKEYKLLQAALPERAAGPWNLEDQDVLLGDLDLGDTSYLQGILPMYNQSQYQGAITALLSTEEASARTLQMMIILGLVFLGCILLITPIVYLLGSSLTRPINRIIGVLSETARKVSSASAQVSASSHSVAEGANAQASSIEETSASLEEMASMIKQNADNANEADQLMKGANQIVGKANESMSLLSDSMTEISSASEETSKIIKTIDEIAFQTNLLALNAAVEAARAGDAGAGFAVVADEVRNLAMRAAEAAKNTSELIEGTVRKIRNGTELVSQTEEAFGEVSRNAAKVGDLVSEIAAASNEQAQGIEQINNAVTQMEKVVQQNASNSEDSASASEELHNQAGEMRGIVEELTTIVGSTVKEKEPETVLSPDQANSST